MKFTLTLTALLMTSSASLAQSDVITVTATKRTQSVEQVPASVTVLSQDQIELTNTFNSAEDITHLLTGVQAAVANGNQVSFQIRGIGAVDHQALTPTAAAVYADDVFMATNVQTGLFLYDIAGVEVLKGPQGSLYGRNASGGAINILTERPGAQSRNYVSVGYGQYDRFDGQAGYSVQLADNLYARFAGRYLAQRPTLDNVVTDPDQPMGPQAAGGTRNEFGLRASFSNAQDNSETNSENRATQWLARIHYEENNGINPAPRNTGLDLDDHQISIGPDGVQDTDNEFYGASFSYETGLGAWALTSISAFEGYNQQYGFDFDGTQAPFAISSLNANLAYDRDFTQLSQELRLDRDWGEHHTLFGLHLAHEDFSQDYLIWCGELDETSLLGTCPYVGAPGRVGPDPASDGTVMSLLTQIDQERTTAAVFTFNEFALNEQLTLTLGARYTYEDIQGSGTGQHIFDDGVIALNNRDGVGPAIGQNTIYEDRLTGNLALGYALNADHRVYASFASGYKSGGFNGEVQNNATHFTDEGLFNAETVKAYELGYKGQIGQTLSLTAAAFYQDYDAPQARIFVNFTLPDGSSITSNSLSNLDEAVSYGFETETRWTPAENVNLIAALTVLDTQIEQNSDSAGNADLFDGNPLPFASKVSASLYGQYDIDLGEDRRLSLSGHAKYRSAYYLDAEGLEERRQKGFVTLGAEASVSWNASGRTLTLWGTNLLDEDYAVSGFGFIGYNTFIGDPRTIGIRLTQEL